MVSSEIPMAWSEAFETALVAIQKVYYPEEQRLHLACRYALSGQGKRIRPLLCFAAAEACGGSWHRALPAALALEFIHVYSLIHDDLPDLDNDDWRRGRLTTHKVFDVATALLAGDALLTDAFQILSQKDSNYAKNGLEMVQILSLAAGGRGMVLGQDYDLQWTGRQGYQRSDLDHMHNHKTGALIAAACVLGGMTALASPEQLATLQKFGSTVGLAFQIIDDLLDDSLHTGKSLGKDARLGKLTYLSLMSPMEARELCTELTQGALELASSFATPGIPLASLAKALLTRKN